MEAAEREPIPLRVTSEVGYSGANPGSMAEVEPPNDPDPQSYPSELELH